MEGVDISQVWSDLSEEQKEVIVDRIAAIQRTMLAMRFPSIGSIVDEDGTVIGRLGRSCAAPPILRVGHRGPFASSKDFMLAYIDSELQYVREDTVKWMAAREIRSDYNGGASDVTAEFATEWLELAHDAVAGLPDTTFQDEQFSLFHDDFGLANIMVSSEDNTLITAVLDWEGCRISPSWNAIRMPLWEDFCIVETHLWQRFLSRLGEYYGGGYSPWMTFLLLFYYSHPTADRSRSALVAGYLEFVKSFDNPPPSFDKLTAFCEAA